MIAFSGVRSSCETFARKRLFVRLASSASAVAFSATSRWRSASVRASSARPSASSARVFSSERLRVRSATRSRSSDSRARRLAILHYKPPHVAPAPAPRRATQNHHASRARARFRNEKVASFPSHAPPASAAETRKTYGPLGRFV